MNKPITNCHSHIFTGDNVPPYLGKTLLPWPLYYLVNIKWIIALVRSVNTRRGKLRSIYYLFKKPYDDFVFWWQSSFKHHVFTKFIAGLINTLITYICLVIMTSFLRRFMQANSYLLCQINTIINWKPNAALAMLNVYYKIPILLLGYILVSWVRRIVNLIVSSLISPIKSILGSNFLQLLKRYYNIALISEDDKQETIFGKLIENYPKDSNFVVLPMDLDYIKAGKPKKPYDIQLDELRALKANPKYTAILKPFVFAHPYRLKKHPSHYDTIIDCLEKDRFSGIKIYPALGYYPFDKHLLKLFHYACKYQIPITTHCIRGIIFYRGIKEKKWDHHPIFTQTENKKTEFMKLAQFKNMDFINNFTHPLNYLCLLEPQFLTIVLGQLDENDELTKNIHKLYGFDKKTNMLQNNLRELKLCFGHFGGEDEWLKYMKNDLNNLDNHNTLDPQYYQRFLANPISKEVWKNESWYSIIRSIIMNPDYPNVYADISFILYDTTIFPLLKSSLKVPKLKEKILYGTDYYVVRQKGNDKTFWIDIQTELSEAELEQIAIKNPEKFLANTVHFLPKPSL